VILRFSVGLSPTALPALPFPAAVADLPSWCGRPLTARLAYARDGCVVTRTLRGQWRSSTGLDVRLDDRHDASLELAVDRLGDELLDGAVQFLEPAGDLRLHQLLEIDRHNGECDVGRGCLPP
jgi:hypothetical protein